MMSVISAQSTARKMPFAAPNSAPPTIATGIDGRERDDRRPGRADRRRPRRSRGLRPMRSDSRDAGTIATTLPRTTDDQEQ